MTSSELETCVSYCGAARLDAHPEGGARLKQVSKRAKYQAKRQRAMIVLASATLMSPPEIARLMRTDESHVRKVIHAFNEEVVQLA